MNILFLCTGNSCRSQMAEGYAHRLGEGRIQVKSAGIEAHGKNLRAVSAMAEVGIDISEQESTLLTYDMLEWADLVITLCGHADENCPILPPGTDKIHWPIDDPAKATGTDEEISAVFRRVRDEIRTRIAMLMSNMQQESK